MFSYFEHNENISEMLEMVFKECCSNYSALSKNGLGLLIPMVL